MRLGNKKGADLDMIVVGAVIAWAISEFLSYLWDKVRK